MSKQKVKIFFFYLIVFLPFGLPIVFIGYTYLSTEVDSYLYSDSSNFNSEKWKEGPSKYRYSVLSHIIAQVVRKNMSQKEVLKKLGKPDSTNNNSWQYETIRPGYRLIDFSGGGLQITFSQNKILEIKDNTWVD
jgi:hypothetical protein